MHHDLPPSAGGDNYLFSRGQAWFALVMTIGLMASRCSR